ncbi:platelet glycoprotein V [Trichonephila inaurata madagascariensis]|uniref:Platelet glycoprotein V n=1 Tax=Trichonephila inaurata madagascariensis TaxID=2747483 RepID=A0A8X7CRR3_9ARAC|nr:platelet glycoprotein V [Trichonephila inaurata madagascariensis]
MKCGFHWSRTSWRSLLYKEMYVIKKCVVTENLKMLVFNSLKIFIFGLFVIPFVAGQNGSSTIAPTVTTTDLCNTSITALVEGTVETILKNVFATP